MIPIIITAIICATVIVVVRQDLTITIKHVATTEISESMIEYQKILNEKQVQDTGDVDEDGQNTIDDVVSAIGALFESEGD